DLLSPEHAPRQEAASRRLGLESLEGRDCPAGGLLDPTFGTGGITLTDVGSWEALTSVEIQPDGKVVAAGYNWTGLTTRDNFALPRYSAAGALDPAFGSGGLATIDIQGFGDRASAVALQPGTGGKILVAGYAGARKGLDFGIVRLNPDGTLDTTFGGG